MVFPIIIIASVVTLTRVASRLLAFAIQATPDSGGRECSSSRSSLQLVPQFLLHAHITMSIWRAHFRALKMTQKLLSDIILILCLNQWVKIEWFYVIFIY